MNPFSWRAIAFASVPASIVVHVSGANDGMAGSVGECVGCNDGTFVGVVDGKGVDGDMPVGNGVGTSVGMNVSNELGARVVGA